MQQHIKIDETQFDNSRENLISFILQKLQNFYKIKEKDLNNKSNLEIELKLIWFDVSKIQQENYELVKELYIASQKYMIPIQNNIQFSKNNPVFSIEEISQLFTHSSFIYNLSRLQFFEISDKMKILKTQQDYQQIESTIQVDFHLMDPEAKGDKRLQVSLKDNTVNIMEKYWKSKLNYIKEELFYRLNVQYEEESQVKYINNAISQIKCDSEEPIRIKLRTSYQKYSFWIDLTQVFQITQKYQQDKLIDVLLGVNKQKFVQENFLNFLMQEKILDSNPQSSIFEIECEIVHDQQLKETLLKSQEEQRKYIQNYLDLFEKLTNQKHDQKTKYPIKAMEESMNKGLEFQLPLNMNYINHFNIQDYE